MNVLLALAIGALFGAGVLMMQGRDLIRMSMGAMLVSNAVNLLIISAGLARGAPPMYPLPETGPVSDPLVEALALTATVITFGLTMYLLTLIYRVYVSHESLYVDDLARHELEEERERHEILDRSRREGQSR